MDILIGKLEASDNNVDVSMITRWQNMNHKLLAKFEKGAKSLYEGRRATFQDIDGEVVAYFQELRAHEVPVTTRDLILKASSVDRDFRALSDPSKRSYIDRL